MRKPQTQESAMTDESELDIRRETQSPSPHIWDPLARMRQQVERLFHDTDWPDFRLPFRRPAGTDCGFR